MIYQTLASYYDALVEDEVTTAFWQAEIMKRIAIGRILEYACGSGDMAIALAKSGYQVDAGDISEAMLNEAKQKPDSHLVNWQISDMLEAPCEQGIYDGAICLCDSFNYLIKEEQVHTFFKNTYLALKPSGYFIFDTHAIDRLTEFEKEYFETGTVLDAQYEWSIQAQDECLYQNFIFFDQQLVAHHEQHIQRVYKPSFVEEMLEACGFTWDVYTDFKEPGIHPGEKYFYIAKKEK